MKPETPNIFVTEILLFLVVFTTTVLFLFTMATKLLSCSSWQLWPAPTAPLTSAPGLSPLYPCPMVLAGCTIIGPNRVRYVRYVCPMQRPLLTLLRVYFSPRRTLGSLQNKINCKNFRNFPPSNECVCYGKARTPFDVPDIGANVVRAHERFPCGGRRSGH